MIDDESLLAYADGELEPIRAAAVERQLANDPALVAKLEQHRRLAARLRAAYGPTLKEPIPPRLARLAQGGGAVISLAEARAARSPGAPPARDWRAGGLIAAGLVAALALGQAVWTTRTRPIETGGGRLVAAGEIGRALDTQLSGDGRSIRVQLTFRNRMGRVCRSFTGPVAEGVACRDRGHWALQALFPGDRPTSGYRMAASADPRLMRIVADTIDGQPFDAVQERAVRDRGWTPSPR